MSTRRSFIRSTSLFSAGILAAPSMRSLFAKKRDIGLQLYTVRDAMAKDPAGSLAKVAQIGYTTVEGTYAPGDEKFYNMDARAFADLLKATQTTGTQIEEAPETDMLSRLFHRRRRKTVHNRVNPSCRTCLS